MTTNEVDRRTPDTDRADGGRPPRGLKVEAYVFFATAAFFIASTIVYGSWCREPSGIVPLLLTGVMLAMIATFLMFSSRRLEQARPEDDPLAEVADGAGDVGFFPAASYWPLALAASAMLTAIAVAFWMVWLIVMGFGFLFLAVAGWLFEYQRAHASH